MEIDLRGPVGNAYALLAIAAGAARQLGYSQQAADAITARMRAGTYATLLDVMDNEFPGVFRFVGDPRTVD